MSAAFGFAGAVWIVFSVSPRPCGLTACFIGSIPVPLRYTPFELFEEFLPVMVFDFLIGNTDRHQSNWALIMEDKKFSLSPLYDNSSSLCAYVAELKIERYFGNHWLILNLNP